MFVQQDKRMQGAFEAEKTTDERDSGRAKLEIVVDESGVTQPAAGVHL
jgi:hypothetical protein